MMLVSEVHQLALSLPGAEEMLHWSKTSFRINNKIFTVIQSDLKTITIKTTKEERDMYTSSNPNVYSIPESFTNMNYMHINLEAANKEEVNNLIVRAWGLVAPKKIVKAFFEA